MQATITQGILLQRVLGKSDDMFNAVQWAMKAWNPERLDLVKRIHVNEKHLICTDGHRLHELDLLDIEIPDGNYDVRFRSNQCIFLEKDPTATYPDYKKVFPAGPPIVTVQCDYRPDEAAFFIADVMTMGLPVNAKYLIDLFGNGGRLTMDSWGLGKALRFSAPGKRGLVMPLHRKTEATFTKAETQTQ